MDITLIAVAAAALLAGVAIALLVARRGSDAAARGQEIDLRLRQLADSQAAAQAQMAESLRQQERAVGKALEERLADFSKRVGDRLQETQTQQTNSLNELRERLVVIDKAQQNITELSTQVVSLQDILANKQARGAFGEVQLRDIVESVLPPSAYAFQPTLAGGRRPDCLIRLPNPPGPIVIDAKFPLESYRALRAAADEPARTAAARTFAQDVRYHIAAIREKYIVPGETAESALMFLPSEAVYAELHANYTALVEESYRARVWIVSPTTLMATLNTVRAVLKDVRMREQAGVIQAEVRHLLADVGRLDNRAAKLQRHFEQAGEDLRQLRISTEKVVKRGDRIEELEFEEGGDAAGELAPRPAERLAGE